MMKRILAGLLTLLILLSCAACAEGGDEQQTGATEAPTTKEEATTMKPTELPEPTGTTPEQMGISSADIQEAIEGLEGAGLAMHSVLVMRHGEIIAEGYAEGYDENTLQRMYSVSKSFVGMAIGVLADEGKIDLDGCVVDYFKANPKYASAIEKADRRIKETTVRDLLKMTSPYNKGSSYKGNSDTDWVMTFFTNSNNYALKEPGTKYLYDTGGTHLLGALVEEVTGLDFLEYLQEKALDRIGFTQSAWCVNAPEGYAWGGSGVLCTTRDLAKFAQLVMQNGLWEGEQLLPADYVKAATSFQVDNSIEGDTKFYGQGYGYQIWITSYTERSFAFIGMGDQLAICIPEEELIFVCTADNQGMSDRARDKIFTLFEEHILNKASDKELPENREAYYALQAVLDGMKLPVLDGKASTGMLAKINGVTFASASSSKISEFTLSIEGNEGILTYKTPRGEKTIAFGIGENKSFVLDEPQYSGNTIGRANGEGYTSVASGAWIDAVCFVISVQVVDDYLGNMRLTFDFTSENEVKVTIKKTAEWFLDEYSMTGEVFSRKDG